MTFVSLRNYKSIEVRLFWGVHAAVQTVSIRNLMVKKMATQTLYAQVPSSI